MNKRHVAVSAEALADLDDIFEFLAKGSPRLALHFVEQLEQAALDLSDTGLHYQTCRGAARAAPVRRKVVGSYNILFVGHRRQVGVLRFLHGKRGVLPGGEAN